ncbi:MAG: LEA type 2 family protein [Bacteroidales bacterium]|nr:LEA type 2 family protein [Bacteroidales bacterium]
MKTKILFVFLLIGSLSACDILQQVTEMQQLSLCTFDLNGVDQVKLAGIQLRPGMEKSGLTVSESLTLAGAIFNKSLPLQMNMMVKVDNPNEKKASLNKMDYILFVDGKELISGMVQEKFEINGGSSLMLALPMSLDLYKVLQNETSDALVNLAFKLVSDKGQPTEVMLKIKPYLKIGSSELVYPGFLTLSKDL